MLRHNEFSCKAGESRSNPQFLLKSYWQGKKPFIILWISAVSLTRSYEMANQFDLSPLGVRRAMMAMGFPVKSGGVVVALCEKHNPARHEDVLL